MPAASLAHARDIGKSVDSGVRSGATNNGRPILVALGKCILRTSKARKGSPRDRSTMKIQERRA